MNHLWQSTLFAGGIWLLTLALRRNPARVRYWLWFAASAKFLAPLALLVAAGSQLSWRTPAAVPARVPIIFDQIANPIPAPAQILPTTPTHAFDPLTLLLGIWACGFVTIAIRWIREWSRVRTILKAATPLHLAIPVKTASSTALIEPGVFGAFRPILLLPEGITNRLTPEEFRAVIVHELCHVRRRDNLFAAIHMFIEALFWFHPLIWWIGHRLVEERERACDEEVLLQGSDPEAYAEGILKVCELYLESPLACIAGVSGANLKKRIEGIMTHQIITNLNAGKKFLIVAAGLVTFAGPLAIGILGPSPIRAQQPPQANPTFEVATVKQLDNKQGEGPDLSFVGTSGNPFKISGNRVILNGTLHAFVAAAYSVKDYQVSGVPSWADSLMFNITAQSPGPDAATQDQARVMLQSLLADRFQVKFHRESKLLPVYSLVQSKSSKNFTPAGADEAFSWKVTPEPGGVMRSKATKESIGDFVQLVGASADRPVINKTGITGFIDYDLLFEPPRAAQPSVEGGGAGKTAPNPDDLNRALIAAIQDQLGLKLESAKDTIEILVIDHAERPSEN